MFRSPVCTAEGKRQDVAHTHHDTHNVFAAWKKRACTAESCHISARTLEACQFRTHCDARSPPWAAVAVSVHARAAGKCFRLVGLPLLLLQGIIIILRSLQDSPMPTVPGALSPFRLDSSMGSPLSCSSRAQMKMDIAIYYGGSDKTRNETTPNTRLLAAACRCGLCCSFSSSSPPASLLTRLSLWLGYFSLSVFSCLLFRVRNKSWLCAPSVKDREASRSVYIGKGWAVVGWSRHKVTCLSGLIKFSVVSRPRGVMKNFTAAELLYKIVRGGAPRAWGPTIQQQRLAVSIEMLEVWVIVWRGWLVLVRSVHVCVQCNYSWNICSVLTPKQNILLTSRKEGIAKLKDNNMWAVTQSSPKNWILNKYLCVIRNFVPTIYEEVMWGRPEVTVNINHLFIARIFVISCECQCRGSATRRNFGSKMKIVKNKRHTIFLYTSCLTVLPNKTVLR